MSILLHESRYSNAIVHSIVNFAAKQDPNFAKGVSPSNVSGLEELNWPKWKESNSALTFIDAQPGIKLGNDTFRGQSIDTLTSIMLQNS